MISDMMFTIILKYNLKGCNMLMVPMSGAGIWHPCLSEYHFELVESEE